jgi:pimeloyl-ACP methyl ester carboxylesterase
LESVREQLPVADGPIGVLGGSLGGAVALNAAIRMRSVVDLFPGDYPYDAEAEQMVDDLDFLAEADAIAGRAPLLVVSGELDHPGLRADALALADALGDRGELLTIPGLAHPLAEEPGIEPAPQLPVAKEVDAALTAWFTRRIAEAG